MPCYTKVLVKLDDDKWTQKAKDKLGIKADRVSESVAKQIKLEAGKLKAAAAIKAINPTATITGLTVGSKELTIQLEI
jgi:hypothetical protein